MSLGQFKHSTHYLLLSYNPCSLYRNWAIVNDYNHGQLKLTLYGFDGAPLTPMFLKYNPPAMWPSELASDISILR